MFNQGETLILDALLGAESKFNRKQLFSIGGMLVFMFQCPIIDFIGLQTGVT